MQSDPREYFQYPACLRCFERPCTAFRRLGRHMNRFLFVHNAQYDTRRPCPFAADCFDETEKFLADRELGEIDRRLRDLLAQMTPDEQLRVNKDHMIESFSDRAGRVAYLRRLWEERIFAVIRVPQAVKQDGKMREWFKGQQ